MRVRQNNMKYFIFAIFVYATYWGRVQGSLNVTQIAPPLQLSEGPHYDNETGFLFYVDIFGQRVNRYDPSSGQYTYAEIEGGLVSIVIPVKHTTDQFVVTRGRDICVITWDGRNRTQPLQPRVIASVEPNKPNNSFDDGKADITGRLWVGTFDLSSISAGVIEVTHQANFYSLDPKRTKPVVQQRHVTLSNGLAWNRRNNKLYYIDTPTKKVVAYDFDVRTATIDHKRTVFDFTRNNIDGYPDGMTIDNDENLWVACYGCGQVLHVNPRTRKLIGSLHMPVTYVTAPTFGGPKLDTLYVTTSRIGLNGEVNDTLSGSLFAVTGLRVRGLAHANKVVL